MTNPDELRVHLEGGAVTTALVYAAKGTAVGATLILGHGAGAGQRSSFMVDFSRALAALGLDVATFNFLYTEQGRKIPDRAPALEACYLGVIDAIRSHVASAQKALFIGGKSMGGRMATQVAAGDAALPLAGLVLLGYPAPSTRRSRRNGTRQAPARNPSARCCSFRANATPSAHRPNSRRSCRRSNPPPTLPRRGQRRSFTQGVAEGFAAASRDLRQRAADDRRLDPRERATPGRTKGAPASRSAAP